MKKFVSLFLGVVSTTFIFAGATQAAEKFDGLARSAKLNSGPVMDGPSMPCQGTPDEN